MSDDSALEQALTARAGGLPRPALKRLPPDAPHAPAEWDVSDAAAFQALERGDATPDQQKNALRWLLHEAARINDLSYRLGNSDGTAFAEGRRFTGLQVVKLLRLNMAALRKSAGQPSELP